MGDGKESGEGNLDVLEKRRVEQGTSEDLQAIKSILTSLYVAHWNRKRVSTW